MMRPPEQLVADASTLLRLERAEETAREATTTLRAVVEASPLGVIATDVHGRVVRWSSAAERIFGWHEGEVIGQALPIVPPEREDEFRGRLARTLAGHSETGFETERLRKDGSRVAVSLSTAPLLAATGEVTGTLAICEDITERKRAEQEMARLYAEASRAARVKDEFLATLSHELRTPMNAMSVWVHLLRRGEVPADRVDYALEVIERNTKAQLRLIEDILDVSRIVSGKLRLQAQIVDLIKVAHTASEMLRPAAAERKVTLAVSVPSGDILVQGDAQRLQQVITNLLSNAVKFTAAGGRVELGLRVDNGTAAIEVTDSGVGIDPQFLPHVFERFTQADSSTSRSHGGLGLGLAIVRYLVEAHRGSVAADSRGVGQGSTFRVTLPLASDAEVAAGSEEAGKERVVLTGIKVLVVDDDRDTRDLLYLLLAERGAMVRAAGSVAEATAIFATERPGVVIADIGMPGEDGYMLLERLRAIDAAAAFHAIAVSGYVGHEDRSRARAAGFQDHLAKPLDIPTLMRTIVRASATRPTD
jgi:PAS domain S-box-containing protein